MELLEHLEACQENHNEGKFHSNECSFSCKIKNTLTVVQAKATYKKAPWSTLQNLWTIVLRNMWRNIQSLLGYEWSYEENAWSRDAERADFFVWPGWKGGGWALELFGNGAPSGPIFLQLWHDHSTNISQSFIVWEHGSAAPIGF